MNCPTIIEESGAALSIAEHRDLEVLESAIEHDLQAFIRVGLALGEIRDRRLYREIHRTFEAYLADRWGLKRQRGYELIEAAGVAASVSEISDIRVERESHAAELADVPAEDRSEVLREAAAVNGGKVTASGIKKVKVARTVTTEAPILAAPAASLLDHPEKCIRTDGQPHQWIKEADGIRCRDCGLPKPTDRRRCVSMAEAAEVAMQSAEALNDRLGNMCDAADAAESTFLALSIETMRAAKVAERRADTAKARKRAGRIYGSARDVLHQLLNRLIEAAVDEHQVAVNAMATISTALDVLEAKDRE